jgi:hypothetical protein
MVGDHALSLEHLQLAPAARLALGIECDDVAARSSNVLTF